MAKRTLFLITLLLFTAVGLVLIASYSPYSSPVNPPKITPAVALPRVEQTVLRFNDPFAASGSAASNAAKAVYSLPLIISTGDNLVTAVQIELSFDPEVLGNVAVNPGSFFKNPIVLLNDVNETTGKISYAVGINPQDNGIRGEGVAVVINFQAKVAKPQSTSINFLPKTLVTAESVAQSVLKTTTPAQFVVGQQ